MSAALIAEPGFAGRTLADIAATVPGATSVFRQYKLDFCCGGKVPLTEAVAAKGLSLSDLEADLRAIADESAPSMYPAETEDMIALIETRYHAVHRRELPELIKLARRVEVVHKGYPDAPVGLADHLARMERELESHMQKEETVLFPLMRRGGHPMITQPIAVMLSEHDDHGAHLRRLEALTGDFVIPDHACSSWRALYVGAKKLSDDLMEHIHIENNLLFPRFAD